MTSVLCCNLCLLSAYGLTLPTFCAGFRTVRDHATTATYLSGRMDLRFSVNVPALQCSRGGVAIQGDALVHVVLSVLPRFS